MINCVRNRKLDDRMVKENNEWERVGGVESCHEVSYDPALGRYPAKPFATNLRDASHKIGESQSALPNW